MVQHNFSGEEWIHSHCAFPYNQLSVDFGAITLVRKIHVKAQINDDYVSR